MVAAGNRVGADVRGLRRSTAHRRRRRGDAALPLTARFERRSAAGASVWHAGATHAAATTADYALLVSLFCLALTVVFGQPPRRRRARVPINQAVPHEWWPRETDSVQLFAACVGAPLIVGVGAAMLLFR